MSVVHWHILGAGAMGTLIAARLQEMGLPFDLLSLRDEPGTRQLDGPNTSAMLTVGVLGDIPHRAVRYLLLATKATQLAPALQRALPYLAADAQVLICANGLGFEPELRTMWPRGLLRAVTTEGANRSPSGRFVHAGEGETQVGGAGNRSAPTWFNQSLGRLPRWHWTADIDAPLLRKFAVNCVINPLTARHDCRNGALVEDNALREELAGLCLETQQALQALGLWRGEEPLLTTATRVCRNTADNISSMLQDRRHGRETEWSYLSGHLLALADARDLDLPLQRALQDALNSARHQPPA